MSGGYDDWKSRDLQAEWGGLDEESSSTLPSETLERLKLRAAILEMLEQNSSRCCDDSEDRKALATVLTDSILMHYRVK